MPTSSSTATPPQYRSLDELLALIPGEQGVAVRELYRDNWKLFAEAPGSRRAHQAWSGTLWEPGGYVAHVTECLNVACVLYESLGACRPLPFSLGDLLLVLALHDVEKPARYVLYDPLATGDKAARSEYRLALLAKYGIHLTPAQANALRYVEGEGSDYTPGKRVQGPLGSLASCADLISARLWYEHPTKDDPWPGAAALGPGDHSEPIK